MGAEQPDTSLHVELAEAEATPAETATAAASPVAASGGHSLDTHGNPKKTFGARMRTTCFPSVQRDEAAERGDKDVVLKATIRELVVYLCFVVVLTILTFGVRDKIYYYFTRSLQDLFVNNAKFNSIGSADNYFDYLQDRFPQALYWEEWYNEQPMEPGGFVYGENKVLGLPMLRQLRVKNDSCVVYEDFRSSIPFCYDQYSKGDEDKWSFADRDANVTASSTAWTWRSEDALDTGSFWGEISSYPGNGYAELLPKTEAEYAGQVQSLKDNLWLDRGTRAVFIDFSLYNANLNLFCVVRLVAEFPASGGVVTESVFRTVRLIRYVRAWDYFIAACEMIFVAFVCYYIVEEAFEIRALGWRYFKHFWNWLDVVNLMIAVAAIAFNLVRYFQVNELMLQLTEKEDSYANFEQLSFWEQRYNELNAVNVFICWIKIFKFLSFNKTMTQLSRTLSAAARDLAGFAVMFFIVFLAYAQFGYLVFGNVLRDFHTFHDSMFTLFRIILGDFDFLGLEEANRVLGPVYFVTYIFFVFFILLNMFLAIVADTYSEVKEKLRHERSDLEFAAYFRKKLAKIRGALNSKKAELDDLKANLDNADTNDDFRLDYDELVAAGGEQFARETMAIYDRNQDGTLDEGERARLMAELEERKRKVAAELSAAEAEAETNIAQAQASGGGMGGGMGGGVGGAEFANVVRRVDRLEQALGSIASQIDRVLTSLDRMELARARHHRSKRSKTNPRLGGSAAGLGGVGGGMPREDDADVVGMAAAQQAAAAKAAAIEGGGAAVVGAAATAGPAGALGLGVKDAQARADPSLHGSSEA